jgi:hypothetical protein
MRAARRSWRSRCRSSRPRPWPRRHRVQFATTSPPPRVSSDRAGEVAGRISGAGCLAEGAATSPRSTVEHQLSRVQDGRGRRRTSDTAAADAHGPPSTRWCIRPSGASRLIGDPQTINCEPSANSGFRAQRAGNSPDGMPVGLELLGRHETRARGLGCAWETLASTRRRRSVPAARRDGTAAGAFQGHHHDRRGEGRNGLQLRPRDRPPVVHGRNHRAARQRDAGRQPSSACGGRNRWPRDRRARAARYAHARGTNRVTGFGPRFTARGAPVCQPAHQATPARHAAREADAPAGVWRAASALIPKERHDCARPTDPLSRRRHRGRRQPGSTAGGCSSRTRRDVFACSSGCHGAGSSKRTTS